MNDLTAEALEGYENKPVKYLYSSSCWYSYHLGKYLQKTGRTAPKAVRMSRGSKIRANDMLFEHIGQKDGEEQFSRIS